MSELEKLQTFLKLKSVYRGTPIEMRFESSAEHSWSCLILADFFLDEVEQKIDRNHVMDMLLYHDVVEIEAGDVDFADTKGRMLKAHEEAEAIHIVAQKIPSSKTDKCIKLFTEFEKKETIEARFAQAIDKFEPALHLFDYKEEWRKRGYTEKFLREKKDKYFQDFPLILSYWNEILTYLLDNELIERE